MVSIVATAKYSKKGGLLRQCDRLVRIPPVAKDVAGLRGLPARILQIHGEAVEFLGRVGFGIIFHVTFAPQNVLLPSQI
jgi:hypothetical protein